MQVDIKAALDLDLLMLIPGCTAVLPASCRSLSGHGRPWHSGAVPLTASTAGNGGHHRTRYRKIRLLNFISLPWLIFLKDVYHNFHHLFIALFFKFVLPFLNFLLSTTPFVSGLYISEDNDQAPERFRGLGIRIEDDVVIQDKGGPLILSSDAPKTITDVELACTQR